MSMSKKNTMSQDYIYFTFSLTVNRYISTLRENFDKADINAFSSSTRKLSAEPVFIY